MLINVQAIKICLQNFLKKFNNLLAKSINIIFYYIFILHNIN